jgi:hypothetical protein
LKAFHVEAYACGVNFAASDWVTVVAYLAGSRLIGALAKRFGDQEK